MVVTIAREFGAGGEAVGQIVAEQLGADFLDRSLIAEVARRLDLSSLEVENLDESSGSLLNRILRAIGSGPMEVAVPLDLAAWVPPHTDPAFDPRLQVLRLTQQVVGEAARGGNAVIVGRGGAFILRDQPHALHVFLRAAVDARLTTVMATTGLERVAALKKMKQTDANRSAYIRQVYDHDWSGPEHYDLVIDSGHLGYERSAAAILAACGR